MAGARAKPATTFGDGSCSSQDVTFVCTEHLLDSQSSIPSYSATYAISESESEVHFLRAVEAQPPNAPLRPSASLLSPRSQLRRPSRPS